MPPRPEDSVRRPFRAAAFRLCALLFLGACASPPPAAAPLTEERRHELERRWGLYLRNDPAWPEARSAWLAGDAAERELLLDNLLLELMRDDAAARGAGTSGRARRARGEIAWFGGDAVAPLAEGMRALSRRPTIDHVALERIASTLADVHASGELTAIARDGALPVPARRAALRALAEIEESAATESLIAALADDPSWEVRAAAADALRTRVSERPVRAALAKALHDPDGFVRVTALRAFLTRADPDEDAAVFAQAFEFLLRDPAPEARAAVAEALEPFAYDPRVAEPLAAALRDVDARVVEKAAQSLMNIRETEVGLALVDALERAKRQRQDGLIISLQFALAGNLEARPADDEDPAAWRALVRKRAAGDAAGRR